MYCKICGDEKNLSKVLRFWSPDDGWVAGRLCPYCLEEYGKCKPKPSDYAFEKRGETWADPDDAIDQIYG